jgi:CRISPR-associated endonuclease Cas2
MNYLISYDIGDDKVRTRLHKLLLVQNCKPLQRSVFVLLKADPTHKKRVKDAIQKLLLKYPNQAKDSIIWLALHNKSLDEAVLWGDGEALKTAQHTVLFKLL